MAEVRLDREGRKLSALSRGGCRLIEFISQWTGETEGGYPSQHTRKLVGVFFLSLDHFLGCIFSIRLN